MRDMSDLDRRQFLLRTGRVAGALGLLPACGTASLGQEKPTTAEDPPPPETPASSFRKAVRFEMLEEKLSVAEKFHLLKEFGFEGVELESPMRAERRLKPSEIINRRKELVDRLGVE